MTRKLALVMLATLLAATVVCCAGDEDRDPGRVGKTTLPAAEDQIDEALMLALGQAKNFHRKAKVYMTDGNRIEEAMSAVRQILAIEFPAGSPEGEDVHLDAYALLAKLHLGKGDVEGAMKTVDQGLATATRDSFFLANLHTVKGEVHEARAAGFDDPASADARAAYRAAIESYDASIQINERLQKALAERLKAAP
jgi:tetratricopeptide (TPR) repeat protein